MSEPNDRRVLAAVRFLDPVTGHPVGDGLSVVARSASSWFPNRSGLWVLRATGVLAGHARRFEAPPATPAAESVSIAADVVDREGRFAPRRFLVRVPRVGDALTTAIDVRLCPSAAYPLRATWAAVRVSVAYAPDGSHPVATGIEGALVRLESAELGGLRCATLTDPRGEALVIGHGVPRFLPGDSEDEILKGSVEHTVTVVVDRPATAPDGRRTEVADPDRLWANRATLGIASSASFALQMGGFHSLTVQIPRL